MKVPGADVVPTLQDVAVEVEGVNREEKTQDLFEDWYQKGEGNAPGSAVSPGYLCENILIGGMLFDGCHHQFDS